MEDILIWGLTAALLIVVAAWLYMIFGIGWIKVAEKINEWKQYRS